MLKKVKKKCYLKISTQDNSALKQLVFQFLFLKFLFRNLKIVLNIPANRNSLNISGNVRNTKFKIKGSVSWKHDYSHHGNNCTTDFW